MPTIRTPLSFCYITVFRSLILGLALAKVAASANDSRFVTTEKPAAIYHTGWIDFNKNGKKDGYEDSSLDVDRRVDDLLKRMTMEEKTAQMATLYGFPRVLKDELPNESWLTSSWKDGIGNIDEHVNTTGPANAPAAEYAWPFDQHVRALNEVQRFFVEKTRLGIPVDFSNEAGRGVVHPRTTSFPSQLAIGSTWNKSLVADIGRVNALEAKSLGYTNLYSPTLDLARDPRWGRTPDCYSEDPFLAGELGMEMVKGIQQERVVSTLKHFALYSASKGGRDGPLARGDSQASWREVQMVHLHPFRKAIRDAGALGVMTSYSEYDGIPLQSSSVFLTDILRKEYGFKGYVVSDSRAVELIQTKFKAAPDYATAIEASVKAGLNICTDFNPPDVYLKPLRELVASGRLTQAMIDSRVRDILRVKFWLGLFDQPYRDPALAEKTVRASDHLAVARRAALESIVLLKNDRGTLPLRKGLKKIFVTGPLANDVDAIQNRYAPQRLEFVTVLAGLRKKLGTTCEITYLPGCSTTDENYPESDVIKLPPSEKEAERIARVVAAAKEAEVAVVVVGENDNICRESRGRVSLDLPGHQEDLVRAIQGTGVPVVLVLINGRPLSINWAAKNVPAILETWFPGEMGGEAIADVLCGDYNPAGRLPITVLRSAGHIPFSFPSHTGTTGRDIGQVEGVLYPFGHGLSYTTFNYSNLRITPAQASPGANVLVTVDVSNAGKIAGDEVVQLYLKDQLTSIVHFDKVLRGFERIHVAPGESKTVQFTLTPEHLALYNQENRWVVEPGAFTVQIGTSSEAIKLEQTFTIADR
jgi:beta-glucosidase